MTTATTQDWADRLVEALQLYPGLKSLHVADAWRDGAANRVAVQVMTRGARTIETIHPEDAGGSLHLARLLLDHELLVLDQEGAPELEKFAVRVGLSMIEREENYR